MYLNDIPCLELILSYFDINTKYQIMPRLQYKEWIGIPDAQLTVLKFMDLVLYALKNQFYI